MEGSDQSSNPCAICLSDMGAGDGQAIFMAECSHKFHFHCISASVAHGNHLCPLCNAQWRQLPFLGPPQPRFQPMHVLEPPDLPAAEPEVFDDDEQVETPAAAAPGDRGTMLVRTHTEYSAIARDSSQENFAAVVHVKAPGITAHARRAPLDLVTVLDVSGSMRGEKLALLKQAMGFVIDNLGPDDRLSVVSFSSVARRVTRLLRMSGTGKDLAKGSVESLVARGSTSIAEGLRIAAKVLDERRHRNAVSSVILLSDGQDNYTMPMLVRHGAAPNYEAGVRHGAAPNYEALVPASFTRADGAGNSTAPIHTFGFGNDHDAAAMNVVAEATGGTFSFIENEAVVQDSFAQCIGGLLTVVVQEARIAIACGHPGVRVTSVKSGRYESRIDEDGRSASIQVGELYADEERRFLLFLAVPSSVEADGETEITTTLIKVSCSYRDAAGGADDVSVTAEDAVVIRPEQVVDAERSLEVARERVRVEATEDIAAARAAAERGAYQEAVRILENRRRAVAESEAALGGDRMTVALGSELQEMRMRVSSGEIYARSGRALMLSGINTHSGQRANSSRLRTEPDPAAGGWMDGRTDAGPAAGGWMDGWTEAGPAAVGWMDGMLSTTSFTTPAMRDMLLRSQLARGASAEQPPQPNAGEEEGGSGGPMQE